MANTLLDTRSHFWRLGPFYGEEILFPNTFFVGLSITVGRPFWIAVGAGVIRLTVGVDPAHLKAHMPPNAEKKDETPTLLSERLIIG